MAPLRTVVVGLDGAEPSNEALRWVAAKVPDDASIHLVHAISPASELAMAAVQPDRRSSRQHAEEQLASVWSEPVRGAGFDTSERLIDDDPADALIAAAHDVGADAIVVGSHGGCKSSSHLGHVIRKLAHKSPVPLIIGRLPNQPNSVDRAVLACLSYGAAADATAEWGARFASTSGLPLHLLHVVRHRPVFPVDSPSDALGSLLGDDLSLEWAETDLVALLEEIRERHPDVVVTGETAIGGVVRNVLQRAETADLVVLGQSHSDLVLRGLAWSRTRQIVAHSPTSVVLVPSQATSPDLESSNFGV